MQLSPPGAASARSSSISVSRLAALDWDFADARTDALTHSLHPYPSKFIPQLPRALIEELSEPGELVADIFCGSGTTLLEALRVGRAAVGIDANPIACLVSRAKTTPLERHDEAQLATHVAACDQERQTIEEAAGAYQSPGWRPASDVCAFWFEPWVVEELAAIRLLTRQLPIGPARTLAEAAFSAVIVAVSKQDSDTRYVRREKSLKTGDAIRRYLLKLRSAIQAARSLSSEVGETAHCFVLHHNILDEPETPLFDLVVTSPPYPNAYSHHLYHRTRLLWLGLDGEGLRRAEIGSHRKYSARGPRRATAETFRGEFQRIFRWLSTRVRPAGYACFVVGDSTLGGVRVDNASLLAEAAREAGFCEKARLPRNIALGRKSFNPRIGKIKTEHILILQRS